MHKRAISLAFVLGALLTTARANTPQPDAPAPAFQDCTTPAFAKTIVEDTAFVCVPLNERSFPTQHRTVQVRTLRDKDDTQSAQYEPLAIQAAEETIAAYNGYNELVVPNLTIILMDPALPRPDDTPFADANTGDVFSTPAGECAIRLHPGVHDTKASSDPLFEFKNTVAHEIFHCVQAMTWPDQFRLAGEDANWWIEGSAELMGYVVYEDLATLQVRADQFGTLSQQKPLTQIAHENLVLFSWLWSRDPFSVFELIRNAPREPGEGKQRAELIHQAGETALAEFARDYVDGKVRSPDGAMIQGPAVDPPSPISASGTFDYPVQPLTVFVQDVSFEGGAYMATTHGAPIIFSRNRSDPQAVWETPMMLSAEGACEQPVIYRFAGMGIGAGVAAGTSGAESFSVEATQLSKCEVCEVTGEQDQCLIGTWRVNRDSLAEAVRLQQPGALSQVIVGGVAAMEFRHDGRQIMGFSQFSVEGVENGTADIRFRIYLAGTIESEWSAKSENMRMCYRSSNAVMQITASGRGLTDPIAFADMPMQKSFAPSYKCAGNELMLTQKIDGELFTFRLDRVGGESPNP